MSDPAGPPVPAGAAGRLRSLVASAEFQRRLARVPLLRRFVRREGEAIFDLLAGFAHTQALTALVELGTLEALSDGALPSASLASRAGVPPHRMDILLRAGVALDLLKLGRGRYRLSLRGAALTGVPGLTGMIRHNALLYRDLADPAAFFRGDTDTELAAFWPYVFGAGAVDDPATAARYSEVMAQSQALVADDVLAAVSFADVRHLLDIGGGTGAFLGAVGRRYPDLARTLFDLPPVIDAARDAGFSGDARLVAGSFRDDPLPQGADAITLVRILFDHSDATVRDLLAKVRDALPSGGRLIVAEPMGRDDAPARAADGYYALYTLAMGTGRTRTVETVSELLREAGFGRIETPRAGRPFVTRIVMARKP